MVTKETLIHEVHVEWKKYDKKKLEFHLCYQAKFLNLLSVKTFSLESKTNSYAGKLSANKLS